MLKEQAKAIAAAVFCVDLTLVAAAFLLAHALRRAVLPNLGIFGGTTHPLGVYLPLLPLALVLFALPLLMVGSYRSHRTVSLGREAADLARVTALAGLAFVLLLYFLRLDERLLGDDQLSRGWIVLFVGLAFLLLLAEKVMLRITARQLRLRGYNYRTVLIVGSGPIARSIDGSIASHRYWGFRILGYLANSDDETHSDRMGRAPLGSFADLARILEREAVDEVVLTVDYAQYPVLEEGLLLARDLGVIIRFAFDPFPTAIGRLRLGELDGIPLVTWSRTPASPSQILAKRLTDLSVAAAVGILMLPLMAAIAVAIRFGSRGPVLYRQIRAGLNGRTFTMLKFRTMVHGAETHRHRLVTLNEMSGPVFKVRGDPRITPVGRFLRRFSLDELPQLWNVVKGDMSLVGPRPPIPEEVELYDRWQKRRLSMRPGLTCLWQIGGRNEIDFSRWMELDLAYIDNWSPWLDMKILAKTIPVVLSGRGAY